MYFTKNGGFYMTNRLKELRKSKKMSQKTLGAFLHISQQSVSRMEHNIHIASIHTIIRTANFFHVTSDYLLGLSNQKENIPSHSPLSSKLEQYHEYLFSFKLLTTQQQEITKNFIHALQQIQDHTYS